MSKKGVRKHLKALAAPSFWPVHRKEKRWVVRPSPGPHPIDECLPLIMLIRDILGLSKSTREAKLLLSEGHLKVDGKIRKDGGYPVGLMDVVEILDTNKSYRILPSVKDKFKIHPINESEKVFKLCKIVGKTTLRGGSTQINLHDSRNIIITSESPSNDQVYNTSDVLKIGLPDSEIIGHLKLMEGFIAVVTGGKNIGRVGIIKKIEKKEAIRSPTVMLEYQNQVISTILDYIFVVGDTTPWISLPEVG